MSSPERRAWVAAGGAALLLAGCGFKLRQPPQISFRTVALKGFAPRSPMAEELRRSLRDSGVQAVDPGPQAELTIENLADAREKTVVATTADGQVRELQLRVRFKFRAVNAQGGELLAPDELLLTREMSYNETNALAKEQEEAQLFRAMQSDIVAQVMRRLATARP